MNVRTSGGSKGEAFQKSSAARAAPTTTPAKPGRVELSLPDEPLEPVNDISKCSILIHGESGIGKSSLAASFEDPLFLNTEPGGKGLRVNRVEVQNWSEFKGYVTLIRRSTEHRTIVVDTVNRSYEMAFKFTCDRLGVDHPSEGNYGDIWNAIEKEWTDEMLRLMKSGRGVIFISHSELAEFQSRRGQAYNKIVPAANKNVRKFLKEECDIKAYYGYFGDERYLTIQGSDDLEAGHRMEYQFWCTDGVNRVHSIPMFDEDNPAFGREDAYQRLVAAFNNEQEGTGEPGLPSVLQDTKVVKKKEAGGRPPRR